MTAPDHTTNQFTNLLHARGHPYMKLGLAVPFSVYIAAARTPPRSEPQKRLRSIVVKCCQYLQ